MLRDAAPFRLPIMTAPKFDILIAEDDPVLRDLYIRKFSKRTYDIRTAEDGRKTLAELQKKSPDVLLLDINMPEVDGVEVMKAIPPKGQRPYSVIVLTNHDEQLMKDQMKELGADDYFVKKDMSLQDLLDMAENLLSHK